MFIVKINSLFMIDTIPFENSLNFANQLDSKDILGTYRQQFHIPKGSDGADLIYLCGNSLGLQPKVTASHVLQELEDWKHLGVEGHLRAKNPWMPYHENLSKSIAKIVGAKETEVVCMDTLTANLHFLMVSFYRPTKTKYKILIEEDAFPSDRYAVASQLKFHGHDPDKDIVVWEPEAGQILPNIEDLKSLLEKRGEEIAMLLIGGVNYYTGQYFDIKKIADLGHAHNCMVGIDLAHGAGNIFPDLHQSNVDFAAWCSYKYLNAGPGSVAGIFVNEKHTNDPLLPRFEGWWGHNKQTRFNMRQDFDPIPTAEAWQLSNPSILSMAALKASLTIFDEVGMEALVSKSRKLTGYLEFLINALENKNISIITPKNPEERGCQLSIQLKNAQRAVHKHLENHGVICDWREPDVIRVAPAPLYNTYKDVYNFTDILKKIR